MVLRGLDSAMRVGHPLSKVLAGAFLLLVCGAPEAREIAVSCSGTTTTNNRNHANEFPSQSIASSATWFVDTDRRTADYQLYGGRVAGKSVELGSGQLLVCREICGTEEGHGTDHQGTFKEEKTFDRVAIDVATGRTSFVTRQVRRFPDGSFFDMSATFVGECDRQALAQVAGELGGVSTATADGGQDPVADAGSRGEASPDSSRATDADAEGSAAAEAQRAEEERRRVEAERLAAQERRAVEERRAAEERLREAEKREEEMRKRLEEQERRLAELQRKEEEANRPVEFKEGVVLCQMGSNENAIARCHGPLQTISSAIRTLDDAYTRAQIGMACGSDRNLRDIGMVSGMRAFGCGFGIHPDPAMASFPGNNDVPGRMAIYVADRGVFRCPRSVKAYCTNR